MPADIIKWTEGRALIATGSPFEPVEYEGKTFNISQCNNSYIFPGIGLGVLAVGATRVTESMLMASSNALADCSPKLQNIDADLLPDLNEIQKVSKIIAFKVAKAAMETGVAPIISDDLLNKEIENNFWKPEYRDYKRVTY